MSSIFVKVSTYYKAGELWLETYRGPLEGVITPHNGVGNAVTQLVRKHERYDIKKFYVLKPGDRVDIIPTGDY